MSYFVDDKGHFVENPLGWLERRVLGGFMEFPEAWLNLVCRQEFFEDVLNQKVFELIQVRRDRGESADRVIIGVDACGNVDLVQRVWECFEDKPFTVVDLEFWFEELRKQYVNRELAFQAKRIVENPVEASDALQIISELQGLGGEADVLNTVQEDFDDYLEDRKTGVAVISTGEPAVDSLLGGGWRAGVYGVAGRPKQGKSIVMLHFARKLAEQGRKVLFVSYEMDKSLVYDRILSAVLGIDSNLIATHKLDFELQHDDSYVWAKDVVAGSKLLLPSSLIVASPADREVDDLQRLIDKASVKLGGLDAVFVDYAQIMTLPKHRGTEAEMHSALSSRLQQLTMRINLPVITGLQLRKPDTVSEKRVPDTSDIAGSDKYARDVVGILYLVRSHMPDDDPYSAGSELFLKLGTSRFVSGAGARFKIEDKFSRIKHLPWR